MARTGAVHTELTREEYRTVLCALGWEIAHWQERTRALRHGTYEYRKAAARALDASALRTRLRRIANGPGFVNVARTKVKRSADVPEAVPVIDGDLE